MTTFSMSELRDRERAAFRQGAAYVKLGGYYVHEQADALYPKPTITRPRVIEAKNRYDGTVRLKFENGKVWRTGTTGDVWYETWYPPAYWLAVAELIKNPTETVEV